MNRQVFRTLLAVSVALFGALAALADDLECSGTLGPITVENVIVPAGASCKLNGTRLEGNIKVESNATLHVNGARVKGNIQADGFTAVIVRRGTEVLGNVELINGGRGDVLNSIVRGNVKLENNDGRLRVRVSGVGGNLQASKNSGKLVISSNPLIDGDLQVFEHFGRAKINQNRVDEDLQVFETTGDVRIKKNRIGGNLQCKENSPPVIEGGNTVGGNKECEPSF